MIPAVLSQRVNQLVSELATIRNGTAVRDRLQIARILLHAHLHLGEGRRLFGRLPAGDPGERTVKLRSGRTVHVRPQDAIVFYEHFGLDVYGTAIDPPGEIHTVVDLGANVGYATLALAERHPGARFVCVEPAAPTRALLERNLATNNIDSQVFGLAVAGTPGRFSLEAAHYAAANRMVAEDAGDVEGVTLGELLNRAGVETADLLKIDIEGGERGVFEGAGEWATRVTTLIGEIHAPYTADQAAEALAPHGFRRITLPADWQYDELAAFTRA